jgi:hypothetical protein
MIGLRNYLTHARPEWLGLATKLDQKLTGRFAVSSLSHEGSPFVPYKALGYGGAVWAVTFALQFIDEFFRRLHLPSPLDDVREGLNTRLPDTKS